MTTRSWDCIPRTILAAGIACTLLVPAGPLTAGGALTSEGDRCGECGSRMEVQAPSGVAQDSTAVAAVIDRFHRALAAGDSAVVEDLLLPDVVVLESGGSETRDEYFEHHLPADIAFAKAVPRQRGPIAVTVQGDVAWATSTSTSRGTYRDRAVNSAGAELIVLRRTAEGWKIAAIHWSSRQIRS